MMGRKLATVETVTRVDPIAGADRVAAATVRGWTVVVAKTDFSPGDRCVFFEIDSFLPVEDDERFAFLASRGVRENAEGLRGYPLRTARIRGAYSQGLILPIALFPGFADLPDGADVTARCGVTLWQPPVPAHLAGQVAGPWPGWLSRTDEERAQNTPELLRAAYDDAVAGNAWLVHEKIDGSSMSAFLDDDGELCVGSRNLNLVETPRNTLWALARRYNLRDLMRADNIDAVQGEAYGEGIQGNPLRRRGQELAVFDVWRDRRRLPRAEWPGWAHNLSVPRRPEYEQADLYTHVDTLLAAVDGIRSLIADLPAEGVVIRPADTTHITVAGEGQMKASFKAISNRYLLKHDR